MKEGNRETGKKVRGRDTRHEKVTGTTTRKERERLRLQEEQTTELQRC